MMQKLKRPVSIILVFMMIVSLFTVVPISASAATITGDTAVDNLSVGDILTEEINDISGFQHYTITLSANGFGTGEAAIDTDMVFSGDRPKGFASGRVIVEGEAPYRPYVKGEKVEQWIVTAVDHDEETITLTGFAEPAPEPTEAPTEANPQAGDFLPESDYLTFTAVEAGSSVTMNVDSGSNLQYNKNNSGWVSYNAGTQIALENEGDSVSFSGEDVEFSSSSNVAIDGKAACSGNVMSLRLSDGVIQGLSENCFTSMFEDCTGLTTAPELPETALAPYCYYNMFRNCESLTTAPELPATTLADS